MGDYGKPGGGYYGEAKARNQRRERETSDLERGTTQGTRALCFLIDPLDG